MKLIDSFKNAMSTLVKGASDQKVISPLDMKSFARVPGTYPKGWLHPTKGWRENARPRGTNKRRKLTAEGIKQVYAS